MKTTATFASILLIQTSMAFAGDGQPDMRVELPRDLRLMLLGVPSTRDARAAQKSLQDALAEYDVARAAKDAGKAKLDQTTARIYFRLGKFDQSLATLTNQLRDQERIKGLEDYRTLARELAVRAESLGELSGDSAAPVVDEGDAVPDVPSGPVDLSQRVKSVVARIDETLEKIERASQSDADRKGQLDRDLGTVGQFVLHIRGTVDQIKDVSAKGAGDTQIEVDRFVKDVQGLIELIRERKREKPLRERSQ